MRLAPALGAALAACGYTMGVETFGSGVQTVAVDVVDNSTRRQRLEIQLTRRLIAEINRHSDVVVTSHDRADALLRVALTDVQAARIVGDSRLPVREGVLDFAADIHLISRHSGGTLVRTQVIDRAEFRSPVGQTEQTATDEALSDLARKIVLALEGDF